MDVGADDFFGRLNDAMDAANMAWWEMELPSGAVFFAENKTRMLGYNKKNFFHYSSFTDLLHPDDYDGAMKAMMDHIEGKKDIYETKYRIKTKSGDYRTFYDRGKIVQRKGENIRIAGMVLDVTNIGKILS